MRSRLVSLADADGHLAELIEAASRGEEIVIEDDDHNRVKLVTLLPRTSKQRVLGLHTGLIDIDDRFSEPLPDSFWLGAQP